MKKLLNQVKNSSLSCKQDEHLEDLCYSLFCKKVTTSKTAVFPENLPPATDAAKYHSYRVFHQVQAWKGVNLDPKDWGLIVKDNLLLPIGTKRPPAPDELMKLIKCNGKQTAHRIVALVANMV